VNLVSNSSRVEADLSVNLTAVVSDAETPPDQMTYQWSATPDAGAFSGTGRLVTWKSPHLRPTPGTYTITVTVTENFTENGQPKQHVVRASTLIHYNDSWREVTDMGKRYLEQLFPNFSVSPKDAVQDFSNSCPGKFAEQSDVAENRVNFQILSGTFTDLAITFNTAFTAGTMKGTCAFVDIVKNPAFPNFGKKESVTGVCTLTTVYEDWRWWLCDSTFRGTGTTVLPSSMRGRVPGRIISDR